MLQLRRAQRAAVWSILIVTTACSETSLSGHWDVMMDPDFKGSRTTEHCRIEQQNQKLTVRCGDAGAAMLGEVNGQRVGWGFTSQGSQVVWSGELDRSTSNIAGAWQFTFTDGSKQRGRFTAQKLPN
jgi:hypothetical protein